MDININIAGQEEGKFRKLYLAIGTFGLIFIACALMMPDLGLNYNYSIYLVFLPGFIQAIAYGLGKKRIFADHFPHLRIDEERIEKSKGGLFTKKDIIYWRDVKNIDLKLFEIHLTTIDRQRNIVDLSNLTDENLKLVKEYVLTLKKNRGL